MFENYRRIQERRARAPEGDRGFTLIELLIVIVVLGILAAVVVFALGGVTGTSAQSACNSDAKSVETAVEAFKANTGAYPATAIVGTAPVAGVLGAGQTQLVNSYLRTWPYANASHYTITVVAGTGEVDVTPNGGTAQSYDTQSAAVSTPSPVTASGCFAVK